MGCGPDLIQENRTGLIFPFGDIGALAGKMLMMSSKEKCRLMGEKARKHIIERYSIEKAAQGIINAAAQVSRPVSSHLSDKSLI